MHVATRRVYGPSEEGSRQKQKQLGLLLLKRGDRVKSANTPVFSRCMCGLGSTCVPCHPAVLLGSPNDVSKANGGGNLPLLPHHCRGKRKLSDSAVCCGGSGSCGARGLFSPSLSNRLTVLCTAVRATVLPLRFKKNIDYVNIRRGRTMIKGR